MCSTENRMESSCPITAQPAKETAWDHFNVLIMLSATMQLCGRIGCGAAYVSTRCSVVRRPRCASTSHLLWRCHVGDYALTS